VSLPSTGEKVRHRSVAGPETIQAARSAENEGNDMKNIPMVDTAFEKIPEHGICGCINPQKEGFPKKLEWLKLRFCEGLKIKTLFSNQGGKS